MKRPKDKGWYGESGWDVSIIIWGMDGVLKMQVFSDIPLLSA